MTPLRIFIGYDPRESTAYHVLSHSILRRSSIPISITPLVQTSLRASGSYWRSRGPTESTEFSITRFLVPYLSGYDGWSVYMDCDMLCLENINQLRDICFTDKAVWVCKHDYVPKTMTKMDGQAQTTYPRKNWSSLMIFNNVLCKILTPEYVGSASGLDLHRFQWVPDDAVGSLPLDWNWLVGEYPRNYTSKVLHYTLGGPWFEEYRNCDHANEWFNELEEMLSGSKVLSGVKT